MNTLWTQRYAQRTERMQSSAIRELLKPTERPEMISFAGGLLAPEAFPLAQFQEASRRVLAENGPQALQYSTTEGYRPLREMIARHTARYGNDVEADNMLITSRSQQAFELIGKVFVNPGDRLLVEKPTYVGALQAWNAYQGEYVSVALGDQGMQTDALEAALRVGPKFIYVLPNFHNPAGVTLALDRRHRLVELADRFGVPLIGDDPYGQLRYEAIIWSRSSSWMVGCAGTRTRRTAATFSISVRSRKPWRRVCGEEGIRRLGRLLNRRA
jgi:2-aminoadipate transaminase